MIKKLVLTYIEDSEVAGLAAEAFTNRGFTIILDFAEMDNLIQSGYTNYDLGKEVYLVSVEEGSQADIYLQGHRN